MPAAVHVFRAGDFVARIAAAHGLTVEKISAASSLALSDVIADGARLVTLPSRLR